jgi:hypothetical protein
VKANAADCSRQLRQREWREFKITIDNAAGITAPLVIESKQFTQGPDDAHRNRWLRVELVPAGPLSGKPGETRSLRIWSRDTGIRSAVLNINAGQGTQDLAFRSDVLLTFHIKTDAAE